MASALIVGGDQVIGIKRELANFGITNISHWPGRKVGDYNRVIPQDIELIVMITDWIAHSFTSKIKQNANRRGLQIIYTHNGPISLRKKLKDIDS